MSRAGRLAALLALLLIGLGPLPAAATGITADVGMTPPLDRWIFRTQLRLIERGDDPTPMDRSMSMRMVPLVLAHGLRSDLTLIGRQMFMSRDMSMPAGDSSVSGRGDAALVAKYRLWRLNRVESIIAVAPTLGLELPTGDDDFGSDTWDLLTGLFLSARRGAWGADLNLELRFEGLDDRGGPRGGDRVALNLAVAPQVTLDSAATLSLWPVLELLWESEQAARGEDGDMANSGGDLLLLSPGLKFARQSFMVEGLLQVPVGQDWNGAQLERKLGGLLGLRFLF